MNRSDTLAAISAQVRRDPAAALWAVGYMLVEADTKVLEDLLEGLVELRQQQLGRGHFAAFYERWGGLPGGPARP